MIAGLQAVRIVGADSVAQLLNEPFGLLKATWNLRFSWFKVRVGKRNRPYNGLAHGNSGVLLALLHFVETYPDQEYMRLAINALAILNHMVPETKRAIQSRGFRYTLEFPEIGDALFGVLSTNIKAFALTQEPEFKVNAETLLSSIASTVIYDNYYQDLGMARLGEVYLDAFRVFQDNEWLQRAMWIASFFERTCIMNPDGSLYWKAPGTRCPTADLIVGNSGILHFLIRCLNPMALGFR
jgi:hypothetical protein